MSNRTNVYRYEPEYGRKYVGHFDQTAATIFNEDTRWNGSNSISVHTGSEFHHQRLLRTSQGRWVMNYWTNYADGEDRYEFIDADQARAWLLLNQDDQAVERYFGTIEEERGPGRPAVGGSQVGIMFPPDMRAALEAEAANLSVSLAELVRRSAAEHLDRGKDGPGPIPESETKR